MQSSLKLENGGALIQVAYFGDRLGLAGISDQEVGKTQVKSYRGSGLRGRKGVELGARCQVIGPHTLAFDHSGNELRPGIKAQSHDPLTLVAASVDLLAVRKFPDFMPIFESHCDLVVQWGEREPQRSGSREP